MTLSALPSAGRVDPSAWPLYPPGRFFDPPESQPDDVYINIETQGPDAGRVFGWVHHAGAVLLGKGWTPPPSPSGLHQAMLGATETAEGELIRTANVGGGVNHARLASGYREAVKHYENTASQLLRVRYYERMNARGEPAIAYAGAAWPDISERDVVMLRASMLSGDWRHRPEFGEFDFAGSQLVNNPGLPLRRVASLEGEAILGEGLCGGDDCCPTCHQASLEQRLDDLEQVIAELARR